MLGSDLSVHVMPMKTTLVALMFASVALLTAAPSAVAATPAATEAAEDPCQGGQLVDTSCERSDGEHCDVWVDVDELCINAVGPAFEIVDCVRSRPIPFETLGCIPLPTIK